MILTKRLYEDQSYLTRCEAKVLEVYRAEAGKGSLWEVIVDRSVFFPEGGGQSPDRGWIFSGSEDSSEPGCAYEVTDVQIEGGVIRHTIDIASENALSGAGDGAAPTLHAGDTVTLQIDWERRFGFMQNHTGEHILSGLMHNRYGFDNIGFHLSDNSVTLDVNGQLDEEQLLQLVWNYEYYGDERTVDAHIKKLRQKIEKAGPQVIQTVWGVGYKFDDSEVEDQ